MRHAAPVIDPETASAEWVLSDDGRRAAAALAAALEPYAAGALACGPEPKMVETARALAEGLGLEPQILPDLGEHARTRTRLMARDAFEASIEQLFLKPSALVFGDETADDAFARFAGALDPWRETCGAATTMAVSGGTVISLYVSRLTGADAFAFWRALRLPQAFVLSLEDRRLEAVIG